MLVAICHVAVKWKLTMLENIQRGDVCIFQNGEEAKVMDYIKDNCGPRTIMLYFNKDVEGFGSKSPNWNYRLDGTWIGNGNDIVKIIRS